MLLVFYALNISVFLFLIKFVKLNKCIIIIIVIIIIIIIIINEKNKDLRVASRRNKVEADMHTSVIIRVQCSSYLEFLLKIFVKL